ncbi:hypothetical protein [Candidatus Fokinia crypta]|nr:hypothetical protein [Candidatus Fokinia cryptica]
MLFITILISHPENSGELGAGSNDGKDQGMTGVAKTMLVLGCIFMLNTLLISKLSIVMHSPNSAYEKDFNDM